MSYCRWSSCDFACDVYVYEDCGGGFTTHVAGARVETDEAMPPSIQLDQHRIPEWLERDEKVSAIINRGRRVAITLEHAGESFNDPDASACADRLESLRALGYMVPQFAIDALREEAATPPAVPGDTQP